MIKSVFGDNLMSLRKKAAMTRKEFADKMNLPVTTIQGYETAGREPNFDKLIRIADFFGVSVDDLIRESISDKIQFNIRNDIFTVTVPEEFRGVIPHALPVAVELFQDVCRVAKNVVENNKPETFTYTLRPIETNKDNEVKNAGDSI